MLKNWTSREDTYIIQKESDNSRFKFLDEYSFTLPLNTNISNKTILVLDTIEDNNIKLKWLELDQHEYVKTLLNMIDDLNKKNTILGQQLNVLQNANTDLSVKTNNNENNIIKVNNKILDEQKINELISSRLNILSVCVNNRINDLEQSLKNVNNNEKKNEEQETKEETNEQEEIKEQKETNEQNEETKEPEIKSKTTATAKPKAKANSRKKM
tara:strand:+ start:55 stop:693 length:639 start_codon:yes stop_codon:yes gene_type:complete